MKHSCQGHSSGNPILEAELASFGQLNEREQAENLHE